MEWLNPSEVDSFNTALARIRADYGRGLAQNTFDQGTAANDYAAGKTALGMQWDQNRQQLPGAFNGRGLLNSGLYKQGLSDYSTQRFFAEDTMRSQYDRQVAGSNLGLRQLEDTQRQNLDYTQKAMDAARMTKASQIRSFLG
jgi:hypothetical protein